MAENGGSGKEFGAARAGASSMMRATSMLLAFAMAPGAAMAGSSSQSADPSADKAQAESPERALYAIVLTPGPAWKPGKPFAEQGLRDHFFYWKRLFDEGRIASAGPLGADHGLVLVRADDQEDADAILAADPALVAGVFTGTVRPYSPAMADGGLLGKE